MTRGRPVQLSVHNDSARYYFELDLWWIFRCFNSWGGSLPPSPSWQAQVGQLCLVNVLIKQPTNVFVFLLLISHTVRVMRFCRLWQQPFKVCFGTIIYWNRFIWSLHTSLYRFYAYREKNSTTNLVNKIKNIYHIILLKTCFR
jgi:hypothetical protein